MPKTMFLPGFSHHLAGRPARAAAGKIQRRTNRLDGLAALVTPFHPARGIRAGRDPTGAHLHAIGDVHFVPRPGAQPRQRLPGSGAPGAGVVRGGQALGAG